MDAKTRQFLAFFGILYETFDGFLFYFGLNIFFPAHFVAIHFYSLITADNKIFTYKFQCTQLLS